MINFSIKLFLFVLISTSSLILAQEQTSVLSYEDFVGMVLQHHPLAKKAELQNEFRSANWLEAKGILDPKIELSWDEKDFDDKRYFRYYDAKLKIPTKFGLDFIGGYENSNGTFLNPEANTEEFGLWKAGIEVNVLQGLFINEGRIALDQAKIFDAITENERELLLNELLYRASNTYLEWQKKFSYKKVFVENRNLAQSYSENTKSSYLGGEKTAMDTLEAFILLQDAQNELQYNEANLLEAQQRMENFLWYDSEPIGLNDSTIPEEEMIALLSMVSDSLNLFSISKHPLIQKYEYKIQTLELDQKLKKEKLKPKLKVKYHPLFSTSSQNIQPVFSMGNYKWGFDFSMPLLFRAEKGALQKNRIKVKETKLDFENKTFELSNKTENSINQQAILSQQIELMKQTLDGYRSLLEGESVKFDFGESSMFLLNKRQEKYIHARLKLIDLEIKYQKEIMKFRYFTNTLLP